MEETIKTLIPIECPHCSNQIIASFDMLTPKFTDILTEDTIRKAKEKLLEKINDLPITDEDKQPVIDWMNLEDTMFGPKDVDDIINNIKKQHDLIEKSEA